MSLLQISDSVEALLQQMTLAEKIGQMTQVEKNSLQPEEVTRYFIGSVLSGGGGNPDPNTPEKWAEMVRAFQEAALKTRLAVPLLYGADCVHGHNNVKGAVIFPHNIGLGAARDEKLVYEIGRITAREMLATGVHWNFAPAVSVPQDIRWGRTYEGYSENTELVIKLSTAYIRGLQDSGVLASVKHFVADGATEWGTAPKPASHENNWQAVTDSYSIDQGDTQINEAVLRSVHLAPYIAAIEAGALNIMVSHSSWNGLKMHANHYLLTTVLKEECGFQGFLVSDWMAINQIDPDYYTCVVKSINAGLDMIMVPFDYKKFIEMLTLAVQKGDVLLERIDDAVRRILRAKYWLDLFNQPFGQEALLPEVGSPAHREVARQAVRQSLVLLKNEDKLLPLSKSVSKLLVAGQGADDIGLMCGGWSISWQGSAGATTQGTTLLEAIRQTVSDPASIRYSADGSFEENAPVGLVVVGEMPYAEGIGDTSTLTFSEKDVLLIRKMRQYCQKLIVLVHSGRPLVLTDQLERGDAWVAAWWPGTEGSGITDVLFGDYRFTGQTAFSWPRYSDRPQKFNDALFPFGHFTA